MIKVAGMCVSTWRRYTDGIPNLVTPNKEAKTGKSSGGGVALERVVKIFVGGSIFVTSAETVMRRDSQSLLSQGVKDHLLAQPFKKECQLNYHERDPDMFIHILNYLRTGKLVYSTRKHTERLRSLLIDAEFYRLPGLTLLTSHTLNRYLKEAAEPLGKSKTSKTQGTKPVQAAPTTTCTGLRDALTVRHARRPDASSKHPRSKLRRDAKDEDDLTFELEF